MDTLFPVSLQRKTWKECGSITKQKMAWENWWDRKIQTAGALVTMSCKRLSFTHEDTEAKKGEDDGVRWQQHWPSGPRTPCRGSGLVLLPPGSGLIFPRDWGVALLLGQLAIISQTGSGCFPGIRKLTGSARNFLMSKHPLFMQPQDGRQCTQSLAAIPHGTNRLGVFQPEFHQRRRLSFCFPASANPSWYQTQRRLLHNTLSSPPCSLHLPLPSG